MAREIRFILALAAVVIVATLLLNGAGTGVFYAAQKGAPVPSATPGDTLPVITRNAD